MNYLQVRNSTGEVEVIITTTEGQPIPISSDEFTIFEMPGDGLDYLKMFYSFSSSEWKVKPERPNEFYYYGAECELMFNQDAFVLATRKKRNSLLSASDWTQLPDSPLTDEKKAEWSQYRQALRDLPNSDISDPNLIQWPQSPED